MENSQCYNEIKSALRMFLGNVKIEQNRVSDAVSVMIFGQIISFYPKRVFEVVSAEKYVLVKMRDGGYVYFYSDYISIYI